MSKRIQYKTRKVLNHDFKILNKESAYWLGFLMADGCLTKEKNLKIMMSIDALDHLKRLADFLSDDIKVGEYGDRCHIQISHPDLSDNLIKLGMMPLKTYRVIPIPQQVLDKKLLSHYIRGYFDGDGWITVCFSYNKKYNKYYPKYVFGICGYHRENMRLISKHLPVKSHINDKKNQHLSELRVQKKQDIIALRKWLYKGSTEDTRIKYKYDKMMEIKINDDIG